MDKMHLTQLKFYKNDIDNSKRPFDDSLMINISTSSINVGAKFARDADH